MYSLDIILGGIVLLIDYDDMYTNILKGVRKQETVSCGALHKEF